MAQFVIVTPDGRYAPTNATTAAYSASLVVKASPGTLFGIHGYNSGPAQFLQLHDATTLPANSAVPVGPIIPIAATASFSLDFGVYGMQFVNGIVISNSTTGPTKTIGVADCWIHVRYV